MEKLTNEKAITLLSVVITIIVMIILTGVIIKLSLGDGQDSEGVVQMTKSEIETQHNEIANEQEKRESLMENLEKDWGISE